MLLIESNWLFVFIVMLIHSGALYMKLKAVLAREVNNFSMGFVMAIAPSEVQ